MFYFIRNNGITYQPHEKIVPGETGIEILWQCGEGRWEAENVGYL